MKTLYLDCFSGISGDMCLGALIDAGADPAMLEMELRRLPLSDWDMRAERETRRGITGTRVKIEVKEQHQPHRRFSEIRDLILGSPLPERVRDISTAIFQRLAEAEGKVHGVPAGEVHFHEVGAVDSIVDIVGISLALHFLKVEEVACSPVPAGSGFVECRHGLLPVPAPATAELLKGVPLRKLDVTGELTTPTGAAVVAALAESYGPLPEMTVEAVGYGFGSKDFGLPNFLRVFIGEAAGKKTAFESETVLVMEANIDDMNPQFAGHVMERLFAAGALEVFISPVYMKKNRPGFLLTALCRPGNRDALLQILFNETTTLGVRFGEERRAVLERRVEEVDSPYGRVRMKMALESGGRILKAAPEYEDCRKIALEKGVPLREVYEAALFEALNFKK
ncbi:MAG: nickel pincer cofactor biosynthesis protein LarC [Peptococcaceae bacterium]|nr:nickel pincer cofactor biosynthesis protein LarC [Peptococcaceae bacterium]